MSAVRDAIDDIRSIDGKAVAGDITAAVGGKANAADVLLKAGGTMTGAITLAGNAVNPLEPVTKQQMDASGVTVNNTLTSTSTTEALSAAQGKALQDGKIAATNYATSTVGGTVKARLNGTTAYFTINGTTA